MDEFDVPTSETKVLDTSHLVEELQSDSSDKELFPVLLGEHIADFHDLTGGYSSNGGYHVVNLIHEVQGPGSPFKGDVRQPEVEIHLDDYWYLEVSNIREYDNYPEENYALSLHVTGYRSGPYSFSEELQAEVDKRVTEYKYESEK